MAKPRTLAVFLVFVLFVTFLTWRTQHTSHAIVREHEQRIEAVCAAVHNVGNGIDSFLHRTIVVPPTATEAERQEVADFLTKADHDFAHIPCPTN